MKKILTLVALFAAAPVAAQQINIAHRGASAYAPEHTFFAYDLAVEMDVDMLECDLILSKDEVPVCIHDETLDRTTGGSATGRVDSFTLEQLRQMDFGSWFNTANPTAARPEYAGAKIVPFEEQLDCYLSINPKMRFHVETKDSAGGRAEQVMMELLTRKGLIATGDLERGPGGNVRTSTVVLQSFDAGSLERMKQLAPTIPTAFLFAVPTETTAQWQLAGTGPDYIDAFAPNSAAILADPTSVERYHINGHDVHTWTVNDSQQMGVLLDLGVDGIFTNNPDLLRAAIDARGNGTTAEERGNPKSFARGCPGVAGRVISKDGPGDVWAPDGKRGVVLKTAVAAGAKSGRYGGALPLGLILLGAGLALWRRHSRDSSLP
jgi:glycerophosphoryl diester phosphodiesterase